MHIWDLRLQIQRNTHAVLVLAFQIEGPNFFHTPKLIIGIFSIFLKFFALNQRSLNYGPRVECGP